MDKFMVEQKKCNFDFYELLIVYEFSFLLVVYVILVVDLYYEDKVVEMYEWIVCFDFDNYNNDMVDGLYIMLMIGLWFVIV